MFRTRFAPSPTGYLHIGGARTALYCWLQAQKEGGEYLLRIEDTDRERSTQAAVDAIFDSLKWLGLTSSKAPVFQTARMERYAQVIKQLLDEGHAYYCSCTRHRLDELREQQRTAGQKPKYDGHCRIRDVKPEEALVVRFKTPTVGVTEFEDSIRGTVAFDNQELDDLVIRRSDGTPTYNLAVVVDDSDMGITHVIRGDDHINNTPKQVNIFNALCKTLPTFAHVPMILGEDGKRLSKRHGAVSVEEYRRQGILPEALLNYLVRLGWSHGDQELFSIAEMIALFDVSDVNRSASVFSPEKLLWVNQQHMLSGDVTKLAELLNTELIRRGIRPEDHPASLSRIVELYCSRASTIIEIADQCSYLYRDAVSYDDKAAKKFLRPVSLASLRYLRDMFADIETWDRVCIRACIDQLLTDLDLKLGKIAQPLRVAITGAAASPAIDDTLELVGQQLTLRRIDDAVDFIEKRKKDVLH